MTHKQVLMTMLHDMCIWCVCASAREITCGLVVWHKVGHMHWCCCFMSSVQLALQTKTRAVIGTAVFDALRGCMQCIFSH